MIIQRMLSIALKYYYLIAELLEIEFLEIALLSNNWVHLLVPLQKSVQYL